MRETVTDKAGRLLVEHRVWLRLVRPECIWADVRGDSALHRVTLATGRWHCTCEARGDCSHLLAVQLVTVPDRTEDPSHYHKAVTVGAGVWYG
jgi:hypothetical protein